jgi:K+-transporting ATPase ATPase C chain
MANVPPALAWSTAASFVTNTNWQDYSGESTMGYLVQMSGLAVQNFLSAAVGIVVAIAMVRGFIRSRTRMNRLPSTVRQLIAALRGLLLFTVICGIIYPVVMFGIAQAAFHARASGSLVSFHGRVVGSSLLCQEFTDAKGNPLAQYFQPRPSAATSGAKNDYGCDPLFSAASNLGPDNPDLVSAIKARQAQIARFDHVSVSQIPPDAVTASASGLDPYISLQNAAIQVNRVAAARHISAAAVRALVSQHTQGRTLGFLGEPRVNVLMLNIALDQQYPVTG